MSQQAYDLLSTEQKNSIVEYVKRGLAPLQKPEPLNLSTWSDKNFYLSAESSSVEGTWETLPYQKAIANVISNDDVRIVTWMKPARVGYTKLIMAAVGYFAEHKKRNQLLYQPTDTDAEDFVKDEVDPMLRDCEVVRAQLKSNPEKRSKDNTSTKKKFFGSILDIKGGKTARNYRRMTKDTVFYDELDGFDQDIDGEGSPTSLGDTRIQTSSFPKSVRGSTPRIKGTSMIEQSFEEADKKFYRYVPCPDCDGLQTLKWKNVRWENGDHNTTYYACEHCGVVIHYHQYPSMDAKGVWLAEDGTVVTDDGDFLFANGERAPVPRHVGFHCNTLYSYFSTWSEAVLEFLDAKKAEKVGNLTKMKTFVNTRLAETWEENAGMQPDWVALKTRAEPYETLSVPSKALFLTMGVDTQNDRLEAVVDGWGEGEESWRIYSGAMWGDPLEADVWQQLDALLNRPYRHASGVDMYISAAAIDSGGGRTQAVYNAARSRGPRLFAIKGMNVPGRPVIGRPSDVDITFDGVTIQNGLKLWPVGVDTVKELVYGRLNIKTPGPGFYHFPIGLPDEYYKQLTSEKLVTKLRKGVPYREWFLPSGSRNEMLDCEVYAYAAAALVMQDPRFNWGALKHALGTWIPDDIRVRQSPVAQAAPQQNPRRIIVDTSYLNLG